MKILSISDLHFGMSKKRFLEIYREKDFPNQKKIVKTLEYFCKKEKIDVMIIAGDLFDSDCPLKEHLNFINDFFKSLNKSKIKVLLISGNHDVRGQNSFWRKNKFPENVYLLDENKYAEGLHLEEVNFIGRGFNQEVSIRHIKKIKGMTNILILHREIQGDIISKIYPIKLNNKNYLSLKDIKKLDFELVILGHLHSFFRIKLGDRRELINCGSFMGKPFKNFFGQTGIIINLLKNKIEINIKKKWS